MIPWHDLEEAMSHAPVKSVWKHTKGNEYIVTGYAMIESTWRPGIMYRAHIKGRTVDILRDAEEFLDGRFERIE